MNNTGKGTFNGKLAFLNTWTYKLGEQILTPVGKQEYARQLHCDIEFQL